MHPLQTGLLLVFTITTLVISIKGFYQSAQEKNALGDTPALFWLGIFVWGDASSWPFLDTGGTQFTSFARLGTLPFTCFNILASQEWGRDTLLVPAAVFYDRKKSTKKNAWIHLVSQ